MNIITRIVCCVCDSPEIEHLNKFKQTPVFMGIQYSSEIIMHDQLWSICKTCGCIFLRELLPLSVVYQFSHNGGVGKTWNEHYESYAIFIKKYCKKEILEIAAGNCRLAKLILDNNSIDNYTIFENNNLNNIHESINVIKSFYDPLNIRSNETYKNRFDTIISSHFLEHMYDPQTYFRSFNYILKDEGNVIFSFPNITNLLKINSLASLHFEHTYLINDEYLNHMMSKCGFKLIEKIDYTGYNLFMVFKKTSDPNKIGLSNQYEYNKKIYNNCLISKQNYVTHVKQNIMKYTHKFIYSCHINSQLLLHLGLSNIHFDGILDNDKNKIGHKIYGYDIMTYEPTIIQHLTNVCIVLDVGIYTEEIESQLLKINKNAKLFTLK